MFYGDPDQHLDFSVEWLVLVCEMKRKVPLEMFHGCTAQHLDFFVE